MRSCMTLLLAAVILAPLSAADWPMFRGPDGTGVSKETGLLKAWPKDGPKLLWKSDKAGLGYAGIAVVGDVVYTMGARGEDEYLLALDDKGGEKWSSKIGPLLDWKANSWSRGPNATPTVDGDFVYALGSKGVLLCAERGTGKEVWKLDLPKDLGGEVTDGFGGFEKLGWGYSWSPLVDGDKLIILPGGPKGLFAALDKKTGKVLWRSTGKAAQVAAAYSSPVAADFGGHRRYLTLTQFGMVGVDAKTGAQAFEYKRDEEYPDVVCPTPIVKDDMIYISVGKGGGANGFKVAADGVKLTQVWENKLLCNYHSGVVRVGDYCYGYHEDKHWACQNVATGEVAWPKARVNRRPVTAGGIVAAEDRLYVLDDQGIVAMLEASPKAFKIISQFKLPSQSDKRKSAGGIWTHPSLCDGKLYLRDQEMIFCYQVK
jgi:outer membrane protein assembly factor BamB